MLSKLWTLIIFLIIAVQHSGAFNLRAPNLRAVAELKRKLFPVRPIILEEGSKLEIPNLEKFTVGTFSFVLHGKLNETIDVAIKFSLKDSSANSKHEYLMYERIGATSDINCEKFGIPFVYYFGSITDYYDVLIMTLLDENLEHKFDDCDEFTREYQLQVFISLLSSLEYIHDKGVFHRDLKDGNVMERKRDGRIFLIDFNLAKIESEHKDAAGSPLFVSGDSLEVDDYQQNQIDDLFSLSFLMYYFSGLDLPWNNLSKTRHSKTLQLLGESKNDRDQYHEYINKIPYADLREIHRLFYNEIWDRRADKKRFSYQVHINRMKNALNADPK